MNKTSTIPALLLLMVLEAIALDFEIGANIGLGFSVGGDDDFRFSWLTFDLDSYERDEVVGGTEPYSYDYYRDEYIGFGGGMKLDVDAALLLNDHIAVVLASGISLFGGERLEQVTHFVDGTTQTFELDFDGYYVPVTLGLRMSAELGRIEPYLYVAPGLIIPFGVSAYGEDDAPNTATVVYEAEMSVNPGFGVTGGVGVRIPVNRSLDVRVEFCPTYAFARLTEMYVVTGTTTTTITYERNDESVPTGPDYQHGGPLLSVSSLAGKVGVVFSF